jgi:hypothetical protein
MDAGAAREKARKTKAEALGMPGDETSARVYY